MAERPAPVRESPARTILVALGVSLACSVVVATAAVALRPLQVENRLTNRQQVILEVAGLYAPDEPIAEQFARIESRLVDLDSGAYVDTASALDFDPERAARDPATSVAIPAELDAARLRRRAQLAPVYLVRDGERLDRIVVPVSGAGLWSTLYGYVALEADGNTVSALRFYEHAETPGLGDQIDADAWLARWPGKRLYDDDGAVRLGVVKGPASREPPEADYQVDGLSGATLTGNGVTNLLSYWFGEHGYAPYLARIREGG